MNNLKNITLLLVLSLAINPCRAQENKSTKPQSIISTDCCVEPVNYLINTNNERLPYIEYIGLSNKENDFIECKISFKDSKQSEYWMFKLKKLRKKQNLTIANLHDIHMDGTDSIIYFDDKAHGSFSFDKKTNMETLDIYYHIHSNEYHYVISWKKCNNTDLEN